MSADKALAVMPQQPQPRSQMIEPQNLAELDKLGALLATSGFFADARDAAKAAVKILAGREMGFPPIASMVGISIIQGKPAAGSNLLAAAMKNAGYTWKVVQRDLKGCKLLVSFRGQELGPAEFTEEDAKRADLLSKATWKQYPKSMYFARAISDAVRTYAPEVLSGLPAYTAEELGSDRVTEDGSPIAEEGSKAAQDEVLRDKGIQPEPEKQKRGGTSTPRGGIISREGLKKWALLKKDCSEVTGSEALYYAELKKYDYEHADAIATDEHVTAIWKAIGLGINRAREEKKLRAELEHAATTYGVEKFFPVLERHNCASFDDVLALDGEKLQALLSAIKDIGKSSPA